MLKLNYYLAFSDNAEQCWMYQIGRRVVIFVNWLTDTYNNIHLKLANIN